MQKIKDSYKKIAMTENYNIESKLSPCEKYMYQLSWKFSDQEKWCVFIMLNPATTTELHNNRTVKNCKTIAEKENCGGMYILDLFAYVARTGNELATARLNKEDIIGADHDKYVREVLQNPNLLIIAAWGDKRNPATKETLKLYKRVKHIKQMIKKYAVSKDIKYLGKKDTNEKISHPYWLADKDDKNDEVVEKKVLENYQLKSFSLKT